MAFKFEKLKVWAMAIELATDISALTESWPKPELYILTSQIKRAGDSIALNIAEGSTGQSNADFKRFLTYAIRSGIEVITALYLAKNRKLIVESSFATCYEKTETLIIKIQALKNSIND